MALAAVDVFKVHLSTDYVGFDVEEVFCSTCSSISRQGKSEQSSALGLYEFLESELPGVDSRAVLYGPRGHDALRGENPFCRDKV